MPCKPSRRSGAVTKSRSCGIRKTLLPSSAVGWSPGPALPGKYLEMPKARYAWFQMDRVMKAGRQVGISMDLGLIPNERAFISLATTIRDGGYRRS